MLPRNRPPSPFFGAKVPYSPKSRKRITGGLPTFFVYTMRRVHCARCGRAKVDVAHCADDKQRLVEALDWFLSSWARQVSWKETAEAFGVNWNPFHRAV